MTDLVVHEGESAFLSVTLFSVEGETTLDIDDVSEVKYKRTVVATGEEVVAETVITLPTANPFTLEQTTSQNVRQNSDWKYERQRVEVTYTYTYNAVSGKVGKFAQEIVVVPNDREVYARLLGSSRFLTRLTVGDDTADMLQTEDGLECEDYAVERIDSLLGKSFIDTTYGIPPIIRQIADMLGSAHARHFLHVAQDSNESKYAAALEKRALEMLKEIIEHKAGIRYLDGTWDEDYPAPGTHSASTQLGFRRGQVLDRRRPFTEMTEFTPSEDDDERTGYDEEDRGTRDTELD